MVEHLAAGMTGSVPSTGQASKIARRSAARSRSVLRHNRSVPGFGARVREVAASVAADSDAQMP